MTDGRKSDIKRNWMGRHRRFLMVGIPLILAVIGLVFYGVIVLIERRVVRWHPSTE